MDDIKRYRIEIHGLVNRRNGFAAYDKIEEEHKDGEWIKYEDHIKTIKKWEDMYDTLNETLKRKEAVMDQILKESQE